MDHALAIEKRVRDDLLRLAKDLDLPLVGTNDLHYTNQEDAVAHDALLCVQVGSNLNDPNRFKFESQEYYLKSPKQMRDLFSEIPEAADNTLLIAERCEINFEKRDLMPRFPIPEGQTEAQWLEREVWEGMAKRFPMATQTSTKSRPAMKLMSSSRWVSPATSSSSRTLSVGPGSRGFEWGLVAVLLPAPWPLMPSVSPSWIHSNTI